jgi:predicted nucleotidyltransferase
LADSGIQYAMSQTVRNSATKTHKGPDPAAILAAHAFLARASKTLDVVGARLYGSRARGDYKKYSDVDLAVFLRGARTERRDTWDAAMEMGAIAFDTLDDSDLYVSALPVWEADWARPELHPNPRLLENIRREGIVL